MGLLSPNILALTLFFLTTATSIAGVAHARIDISGGKTINLTPLRKESTTYIGKAAWFKNDRANRYLYTNIDTKKGEWLEQSVSFMPEADGDVILIFWGEWKQNKATKKLIPVWMYYDNIKVIGATFKNGDFEQINDNGNLIGWRGLAKVNATGNSKGGGYIVDKAGAVSGNNYVKLWFKQSISQTIKVKAGVKVTIKMYVKPVE